MEKDTTIPPIDYLNEVMLRKMLSLGGHTPRLQNRGIWLTRPGKKSGTGCSIGEIAVGVVKIFSDAWAVPGDRFFGEGWVMSIDELDEFIEHNKTPKQFWDRTQRGI